MSERIKPARREVLGIEELSAEDIRLLKEAKVPEEYAYLDELLGTEEGWN